MREEREWTQRTRSFKSSFIVESISFNLLISSLNSLFCSLVEENSFHKRSSSPHVHDDWGLILSPMLSLERDLPTHHDDHFFSSLLSLSHVLPPHKVRWMVTKKREKERGRRKWEEAGRSWSDGSRGLVQLNPLLFASCFGYKNIVSLLWDHGADIERKNFPSLT